jgi:hypothetical protein
MKSGTRDNLIYLGVGLGVAALVVADFFYANSHGQEMWMPSRFAPRAVYTTLLLAYFVVRETRKLKATLVQVLAYILLASFVHIAIVVAFRQAVSELAVIPFSGLATFEMFLVFQLVTEVARYFRSGRHRLRGKHL